jgi:HPr kinase/phosphorylase
MNRVHATCVALPDGMDGWRGVLLRGPSGAGKSDLALRLIDAGARLVADDQTELSAVAGALEARAPAALSGLLEVRGLGIVEVAALGSVRVCLVCDLVAPGEVARMPEREFEKLDGVTVARMRVAPFESSAAAKVRLGADAAARDIVGLCE